VERRRPVIALREVWRPHGWPEPPRHHARPGGYRARPHPAAPVSRGRT